MDVAFPSRMEQSLPATRILIAEDEPSALRTMRLMLLAEGYEVEASSDGIEAFEKISVAHRDGAPYDLLITDIQMPGMTGDELVERIKAENIPCRFLAISGFGEKHLVVKLMRKGCHDFLDKPFSDDDLAQSVDRVLQMPLPSPGSQENQSQLVKARRQVEELSNYVDSFRDEYRRLMEPGYRHGRYPLEIRFQAHAALGGDLFQSLETAGNLRIMAADVAGHDPGASFLNFLLKTYFEECRHEPPFEAFRRTNGALLAKKSLRMVTAVQLELNPRTQCLYYYNAGHPPLLLIPGDGGPVRTLHGKGLPLGFFEDLQMECCVERTAPGDRIVLCTDGITQLSRPQATAPEGLELGIAGLGALVHKHRQRSLSAMLDEVWEEALAFANFKTHDDLLLAAVEVT